MFTSDVNANSTCCGLPSVLRWAARGFNAFIALGLIYLGNSELSGVSLSTVDQLALITIGISVFAITSLYVREFSAAVVVLALGSIVGLALEGRLEAKHTLLLLLCTPATLVWLASRIEAPKRSVQKQLFPGSPRMAG